MLPRYVILADAGDTETNTAWHVILKAGTTKGRPMSGQDGITITEDDIDKLVSTFARERAVGVHHATARAKSDPRYSAPELSGARGWIKALRRVGDALEAKIEWTTEGAKLIRDKMFRYFSLEAGEETNRATGEKEFVVAGGTLTNDPFFDLPALVLAASVMADIEQENEQARTRAEIPPVADAPGPEEEDSDMPSHLELLSEALGQTLTEDNLVAHIAAIKTEADKVTGLMAEVATLTEADAKATTKIATLTAANTAATAESVLLAERVGKLEATNTKLDEEHVVEADLARGALAKAEAGTFDDPGIARKVRRAGIELYADSYGSRPDGYVTGGTTRGHNRDDRAKLPPAETAGIVEPVKAETHLTLLCSREEDQTSAMATVIANLNEKHAGEGDRLHALMLEGY